MKVDKTERLHEADYELFMRCVHLAYCAANSEGLQLNCVMPKARLSPTCAVGLCDHFKKEISLTIRYRQDKQDGHQWFKSPISFDELAKTTLHEVAHLRFTNHSKDFRDYETELIKKYYEQGKN